MEVAESAHNMHLQRNSNQAMHEDVLESLRPHFEELALCHASKDSTNDVEFNKRIHSLRQVQKAVMEISSILSQEDGKRGESELAFEAATIITCGLRIRASNAPVEMAAKLLAARELERERVRQTLIDLRAEVVQIGESIVESERQRNQHIASLEELRSRSAEVQQQRVEKAKLLNDMLLKRTRMQLHGRQLRKEIDELHNQTAQVDRERTLLIEEGKRRAERAKTKIDAAQAKLTVLKEEATTVVPPDKSEAKARLNRYHNRIDELTSQKVQLEDELSVLQNETSELSNVLRSFDPNAELMLQNQIGQLENDLAHANSKFKDERERNKQYVTACDVEIEKLRTTRLAEEEKRLEELKRKRVRLEAAKLEAQEMCEQAKQVTHSLKKNSQQAQEELASMTKEMLETNDICYKLEEQIEKMEKEHEVFTASKIDRNTSINMKVDKSSAVLQEKMEFLTRKTMELNSFICESKAKQDTMMATITQHKDKCANILGQVQQLEEQSRVHKHEIDSCTHQIELINVQHMQMQKDRQAFIDERDGKISELEGKVSTVMQESQEAERALAHLESDLQEAKQELHDAESQLRSEQDKVQPYEDQAQSLTHQAENRTRALVDWENKMDKAQQAVALQRRILTDERAAKQLEMDAAATRLGFARSVNIRLADSIESFQSRAHTMTDIVNNLLQVRREISVMLQRSEQQEQIWVRAQENHDAFVQSLQQKEQAAIEQINVEKAKHRAFVKARDQILRESQNLADLQSRLRLE